MHMRIFSLALVLILFTSAAPVMAGPTAQLAGGTTRVVLSTELLAALTALSVTPDRIKPGKLKNGIVSYPIEAGAIDLEDLRGDIFHSGGISFTAGETVVELRNFLIDTQAAPVLTGLVSVNGDLVGRVDLFDLDLGEAPQIRGRRIVIEGVDVTLTDDAAVALNDIFNVVAFEEGLLVGEATVDTKAVRGTDLLP
jgi:hypothetical protein